MKIKGEVKKVFDRKRNGRTFYSICVADKNEGDHWTSCGLDKPTCREGDVVEFTAEPDGKYFKVEASDVKVVGGGAAPKSSSGGGGGGWNDPARQKSIVAQSSLKMAIDFVGMALANGALVLGTAKAKAADKYDILSGAVLEKAGEFYDIALNPDGQFDDGNPAPSDDDDYQY
jgi:hypothetical protein